MSWSFLSFPAAWGKTSGHSSLSHLIPCLTLPFSPLLPFSKRQQHSLIPQRASAALLSSISPPPPHYSFTCSLCGAWALLVAFPIPASVWVCKRHMHTPIKSTQPLTVFCRQYWHLAAEKGKRSVSKWSGICPNMCMTARDGFFITVWDSVYKIKLGE